MTTAATNLGSSKKRIDIQKDFVATLMSAIDRGVSTLVDADMNSESTKLQALQVQQQLGIQALSIANSSSQNILSLFRNG
jgi:flagellin